MDAPAAETSDVETSGRPSGSHRLRVYSFGLTDRGRVRETNEDQFLIAHLAKMLQVQDSSLPQPEVQVSRDQGYLFVVADGMGGHAGGEQASALAIDSIGAFSLDTLKWFSQLKGSEGDKVLADLQASLQQADAKLFTEAAQRPELRGMGTTVTMAYVFRDDLFVVHVGDSRCYLFRDDRLYRLTRDHTMVEDMIRAGYLQPQEAARHRLRHVITNVVGGLDPGVQVEVHKLHLEPGDQVLLCSDGLTEMVADTEIRAILQSGLDTEPACRRLVELANENGGKDNVTVLVARFEREGG
jgi:protein phosphatase